MENTIKAKEKKAVHESAETFKKEILTLEFLQDMILEGVQRSHDEHKEDIRNFEETRKLINFLFDYARKQATHACNNADEKSTKIPNEIDNDSLLLGYTHYICSCDTNPYNWSYLLESRNRFAMFLSRFTSYIMWVTKDMNALLSSLNVDKKMAFVIDGYFEVKINFEEGENSIAANVYFENLSKIYSVAANGYRLTIKQGDNVLGVFWREHGCKLDKVLNFVKG